MKVHNIKTYIHGNVCFDTHKVIEVNGVEDKAELEKYLKEFFKNRREYYNVNVNVRFNKKFDTHFIHCSGKTVHSLIGNPDRTKFKIGKNMTPLFILISNNKTLRFGITVRNSMEEILDNKTYCLRLIEE